MSRGLKFEVPYPYQNEGNRTNPRIAPYETLPLRVTRLPRGPLALEALARPFVTAGELPAVKGLSAAGAILIPLWAAVGADSV